jgi:maleate cis-trans isomerase
MATRIGVLVPAGNPTVEPELYRMAPASVTLHFARLDGGEGTPGAQVGMERRLLVYLDSLPAVLPTLAAVRPAVVVPHTSVCYALGYAHEPALVDRMTTLAGCPAITARARSRRVRGTRAAHRAPPYSRRSRRSAPATEGRGARGRRAAG